MPDRHKFECAPALRIEAHERLNAVQFKQINTHLERLEEMIQRIERRLWLAVYGVVGVILAYGVEQLLISGL